MYAPPLPKACEAQQASTMTLMTHSLRHTQHAQHRGEVQACHPCMCMQSAAAGWKATWTSAEMELLSEQRMCLPACVHESQAE